MSPQPPSLALLRNANPVSVDRSVVHSARAMAVFERIVVEPRNPQGRLRPSRFAGGLGRRAWLALGGAGMAAVAGAIVAVLISGSAAGPAFAGWRGSPTPVGAGQIAAVVRSCGLNAPVVLAEARGPYTAVVFADRSGGSACVEGPSMSDVGSIGGVHAPDNPIAPGQVQTAVVSGSDSAGHAFVLLAGRVGSAVRSIVIHRSNNVDVTASIRHGWYLAWWPASAHATGASVTTSSGTHSLALPASAMSAPPSCPESAGTGCGSVAVGSESNGSAGVPGPPLVDAPLAKPFHRLLLLEVYNASTVLACFSPPSGAAAAAQPNVPTGPCTHATKVTRLPSHYPVQKNLLEVFINTVWKLTRLSASHAAVRADGDWAGGICGERVRRGACA